MQEYHIHQVYDKYNASGQKGVSIGIGKASINEAKIPVTSDEGEEDEGRLLCITLSSVVDKTLSIWGIYEPTVTAERKQWMMKLGGRINRDKEYMLILGNFNFVMDTSLDKRGGRPTSSMIGTREQKQWEHKFHITGVWRKRNPKIIETTWSNGVKDQKKGATNRLVPYVYTHPT